MTLVNRDPGDEHHMPRRIYNDPGAVLDVTVIDYLDEHRERLIEAEHHNYWLDFIRWMVVNGRMSG